MGRSATKKRNTDICLEIVFEIKEAGVQQSVCAADYKSRGILNKRQKRQQFDSYEGWNFNFGNVAVLLIQHTYRVHIFTDPRCTPQSYVEHVPSDEGVA